MASKKILISQDLFFMIFKYFYCDMTDFEPQIRSELKIKFDQMVLRDLYQDMLNASSPQDKEAARLKYLDAKGIPENFRY